MKVLIFGGFLGSGKTTCLLQLARYIAEHSQTDNPNKVMILENEIGEVGVDDTFLRGGGFQVTNLFAGCACCSVSGEMVTAAGRIQKEYDPEWLVIETTGLAYPVRIQENMAYSLGLDARIGVLADASRWRRLRIPMENLLMGQICGSDAVLVNKTDLVDEDTLAGVDSDILFFEPKANIYHISGLQPVDESVWKGVLGE